MSRHGQHVDDHHHRNDSSHQLNPIEAERIIAILEDTTEKLSFLDSITPDVLQHRDELSKFIGDEISRTMTEQKVLEKRYEELIEQRAAMKGIVNKNKYKEVQEEIQDVSRALRESTNNLVRSLKENPNVSGNLIKVQRDRTELHDLVLRCNQELRDRSSYNTITHKVDEENQARLRLQQLKTREKALRDAVGTLQESLKDEQKSFQKLIIEQRQAIAQLKDELAVVKGSASADAKFRRKESMASVSSIWREFKLKQRVLETRLKELEDKLHTETVVNGETKEFLIQKHITLKDDLARWDLKYDTDVNIKDEEIANLSKDRAALLEQLSILQERKKLELLAEKKLQEEEEMEASLAKNKKELLKRQNRAARRIVKEMRAFVKHKKDLEALGGGAKKGKKEKGGKKKK
jgi:hypothetical protein